jgi:DNA processing protein
MESVQKIDIKSGVYPKLLKLIPDPPKEIFCLGEVSDGIFDNCVGVVGTRDISNYGRCAVSSVIRELVPGSVTVVSGFMYGIDHWAHYYSLQYNFKTIAVMPCGVDIIHPSEQKDLYHNIISGNGLVISEYPLEFQPRKWTYVKRNRIVAGLSKVLAVIQASESSGSIITANYARKYNRKVFAVPGRIFDHRSQGANRIIKEFATLLDSGHQINDALGLSYESDINIMSAMDFDFEDSLLKLLISSPLSFDDILDTFDKDIITIGNTITDMITRKKIKKKDGLYYAC